MAEPSAPPDTQAPEEEPVEPVTFGLWWPAGDPGKLREAAAAWDAMAGHLDTATTTLSGAASAVTGANSGAAIDAFAAHWDLVGGSQGALPTIAGYCRDMATSLREFADAIDEVQDQILQMAVEIAASVAVGVGLAFFTAGLSAGVAAATTARVVAIAARLGVTLGLRAATIISRVAVVAGVGAAESMAANTVVQLGSNAVFNDNHDPLDGFSMGEVWTSGALGFAGGGAVSGAASALRGLRASIARVKNIPPVRPSWRGSEVDVGGDLAGRGYRPQVSFRGGKEVPYGTKGSVRPDHYKVGSSVEVKNYNVATSQGRSGLVSNVSDQVRSRAANLPPGTRQSVVIDVRGQAVSSTMLDDIANRIVQRSGGTISRSDIVFKR